MTNKATELLGQSAEFMRIRNAARMVASTDTIALITGEVGTGKELLAQEIHGVSRRRAAPFLSLNCAVLSEHELEAELLGRASGVPAGRIAAAAGGTLFLDEVSELSLAAQARLLRFLELHEGAGQCLDVRIIASTHRDLRTLVEEGQFREDLYYRLYVVPLEVPPLRQRADDIVLFLKHYTAEFARLHCRRAPSFSMSARRVLKAYSWPGNVRELRNLCERMVILLPGVTIEPDNLPAEIRRGHSGEQRGSDFILPQEGIDLSALEVDMIRQALGMSGGNRSKAARLLGLSRDTLLYRMQKYAIQA